MNLRCAGELKSSEFLQWAACILLRGQRATKNKHNEQVYHAWWEKVLGAVGK
jgi:hypothetical protein